MLEGGAVSDRRERRLTNEASSAAGRCLGNKGQNEEFRSRDILSIDILTWNSETSL